MRAGSARIRPLFLFVVQGRPCAEKRGKKAENVYIYIDNHIVLMKPLRIFSIACTMCGLLFISCAREELQPADSCGTSARIVATVYLPDGDATKLVYSERDAEALNAGLKSVWEEGDSFHAYTDGGQDVTFTLASGAGTSAGIFTADAAGISSGTTWKALLGSRANYASGIYTCSYSGQNGSLAGIGGYDYITAGGTGEEPTFDFSAGERLSYFLRIKLPAGIRYIEYCTSASWDVTKNDNAIEYDGNFNTVSTADLGHVSTAGEVCYFAVPAADFTQNTSGAIFTFFNSDRTQSNGKVLSADVSAKGGKIATTELSSMSLIDRPAAGDAIGFGSIFVTVKKDVGGVSQYNNLNDYWRPAVVSPEWAPFNLGAKSSPASADDQYGTLYSWGETVPRTSFSADVYKYEGSDNAGSNSRIGYIETVGVMDGSQQGVMKFQRFHGTKFDAARVCWGSEWRMPTIEELMMFTGSSLSADLSSTTDSGFSTVEETRNGAKGRSFTKGGKTVFFPYAGVFDSFASGSARGKNTRGNYWGDSRIRSTPSNATLYNAPLRLELSNSSSDKDVTYGSAVVWNGLSIRPVRNTATTESTAGVPSVWEEGSTQILPNTSLYGYVKNNSGNPIAGVVVSDGFTVVTTDSNGLYQLSANAKARTVSVTVPAAYEIPSVFYHVLRESEKVGGQWRKDFTLTPRPSVPSRATIIAVADAHVHSDCQAKFQTAIDDISSTATTLMNSGIPVGSPANAPAGAVVCISLGDQMWDDMSQASAIKQKFETLPVPVFYTIGNHDHDNSKSTEAEAETVFIENFGPTNYSFDIANLHVIVMDDIWMRGNGDVTVTYDEGFTQAQIDWMKADVAKVANAGSKTVVVCVHAPLNTASAGDTGTQTAVMNLKNTFYNVHVLSGHTHWIKNNLYRGWAAKSGRSIYEHTLQSLSGYWWEADISSVNGSPAGYGVMTFDSNDLYAEYNKVTKMPASFQMRVYNGGSTYNKNSAWDEMMHGGARGYKEYTWDSPATNKYVVRLPDAGSSNDTSDYWTVSVNGSSMTRVDTAIKDAAVASYVFNKLKGTHGDANGTTDQLWYSSANFNSSFTVTATHTMPSGWSATYTSTHYVGTDYKGFAYGTLYD